jgi:hypothetical protein
MLVACRLAGLSALEGRYAGVFARTQSGAMTRRASSGLWSRGAPPRARPNQRQKLMSK